jgi:hypothetical protein
VRRVGLALADMQRKGKVERIGAVAPCGGSWPSQHTFGKFSIDIIAKITYTAT